MAVQFKKRGFSNSNGSEWFVVSNSNESNDFLKVEIHAGTVLSARVHGKARKPAYVMEIDFGAGLGTRVSSAQITDFYGTDGLVGRQVVAVTSLPPLRVAGVKSEVLVLGAVTPEGVVLLAPDQKVPNGSRVA